MKLGDAFAAQLHKRWMKPRGFKKKGRTFVRVHADYEVQFNIQGSAWNASGAPWRFYINCAIKFLDLPGPSEGSGFTKSHAYQRLELFVPESRAEYDLEESDLERTVDEVGSAIARCSNYFDGRSHVLRESYVNKDFHLGFPYDPELKQR